MALFGGIRDISLFNKLNLELLKDLIQTEIAYYKFALEKTRVNVYGEAPGKNYYEPIKIACLINREDQAWSSDNFGSDVNQSITYSFLKKDLEDINLIPEVGDLLLFRNNFYEVDSRIENQLILGRDANYAISEETKKFGKSFSIVLNTHISRVEKLNLIPLNAPRYPETVTIDGGIANQLLDYGIGRTWTVGETSVECCNHLTTDEHIWQNTLDNCDSSPTLIYNSISGFCEAYNP
jgi:hypothetical protein